MAKESGWQGTLWLNDTAAWKRCLETNVMGPVIVSQAVLPGMVERKYGHVVNVASGGGLWPVPYDTGYSVTKAGLIRLSEVMALECAEHNVMAFSIHPGVVHTNMSDTVMNDPNGQKWLPAYPEALARGMTPVEKAADITRLPLLRQGRRPLRLLPQRQRRLGGAGVPSPGDTRRRHADAAPADHAGQTPPAELPALVTSPPPLSSLRRGELIAWGAVRKMICAFSARRCPLSTTCGEGCRQRGAV